MAVIKYEDIFDFPSYKSAIKELEAANKEFGVTITAINERILKQYREIKGDLKDYSDILKAFNVNQKGATDAIIKAGEAALAAKAKMAEQQKIIALLAETQDVSTQSVNNLKVGLKALENEYNSLRAVEEKDIARKKQIVIETGVLKTALKQQTAELKSTVGIVKVAEGSYQALQNEMTAIGKALKLLPNAFDAVTGKINKNNKEAVALQTRYLEINTTLKKVDAQLGNFQRNVGNYSSAFKGITGNLKSIGMEILGIVGLFSVTSFFKDSVDEFLEADKNVRILANTLKNIGIPEALGRMEQKAKDLQREFSFIDNDEVIGVFNQLIVYGKLTENQINELLPVIINFATATGKTLPEAAALIIKALEGNGRALKEFGIDMKDAKSVSEGFSLVMKELKPRVDGVGEAFEDSAAGGIATAKQELKDLKEEIGSGTLPILVKLLSFVKNALNGIKTFTSAIVNEFKEGTGNATLVLARLNNEESKKAIEDQVKTNFQTLEFFLKTFREQKAAGKLIGKEEKDIRDEFEQSIKDQIASGEQRLKERAKALNILSKAQKDDLLDTAINLEAAKKVLAQIQSNNAPDKVLGIGDPGKATGGESAEDRLAKSIKKGQDLLKAELETRISLEELALAEQLINEREFQEQKLRLIQEFVKAAIELENKKSKPDPKVLADLNKQRIDAEKEFFSFSSKSVNEGYEQKKEAIQREADFKISAIKDEQELVLSSKKLTDKEREALEIDYQNKIDEILIDSLSRRIAIELDSAKKAQLELQKLDLERGINARNRVQDEKAIEDKYNTEINAAKTAFDLIRFGRDTSFKEELAYLQKLKAIKIKFAKDTAEEELAIARLKGDLERQLREELEQTIQQAVQTGFDIIKNQTDAQFEDSIRNLEETKERELQLAGNNAAARLAIEADFNKRIALEKRKQAKANRDLALFDIAINTAAGVAKTIQEFGMPAAIPFIALAITQGALQAALVLSKPLPQFKEGRKGGPATWAEVDEAGTELIIDKHGRLREIGGDKSRTTFLHEGDSVITAKETERILKMTAITNEVKLHSKLTNSIKDGKELQMIYVMSKAIGSDKNIEKAFEKAVSKIPIHQTIIDDRGQRQREKTIHGTTTYLSNLTKN